MTFAFAVGSLRPISLTVKMVFSFGFSSSTGAAAGVTVAAGAAAVVDGIAISVMFNLVLSNETSSEASSRVSVSIWSTIDVSLELLLTDDGVLEVDEDDDASALEGDPLVAGGGAAAFEFGEMEAEGWAAAGLVGAGAA